MSVDDGSSLMIYPRGHGLGVRVTPAHVSIARVLYAQRPFVMGSTSTTFGAQVSRSFDWDDAPWFYQSDFLDLAHAVIALLSDPPPEVLRLIADGKPKAGS